jgi:phage tail-like protein
MRRANDPLASFNFKVEIQGITIAGFSECTGLNSESNVIDYREGTDDMTARRLPGLNKYSNVTLKRGLTTDAQVLYDLRKLVVDGTIDRRNVSIILYDEAKTEKLRWNLVAAWISKFVAPDLKANASEVAIQTIEFTHEGMFKG